MIFITGLVAFILGVFLTASDDLEWLAKLFLLIGIILMVSSVLKFIWVTLP